MTHPDLDDELRHLLAEFTDVDPDRRLPVPGALIAAAFTLTVVAFMAWLALR